MIFDKYRTVKIPPAIFKLLCCDAISLWNDTSIKPVLTLMTIAEAYVFVL